VRHLVTLRWSSFADTVVALVFARPLQTELSACTRTHAHIGPLITSIGTQDGQLYYGVEAAGSYEIERKSRVSASQANPILGDTKQSPPPLAVAVSTAVVSRVPRVPKPPPCPYSPLLLCTRPVFVQNAAAVTMCGGCVQINEK